MSRGSLADKWISAMQAGDLVRAWAVSDAVLAERVRSGGPDPSLPRHEQWVWNGEPLAGKRVLVRCYHGLGDTLQFIRFAEPLRAIAQEVTIWAQPALLGLVGRARGVDRVLPLHDGAPEGEYDADIEIMELAHALRVGAGELAPRIPYLSSARPIPRLEDDQGLRVGVVWQAGDWDRARSVPASELAPLARLPGIRLRSLQRGPAQADLEPHGVEDWSTPDIDDLAARLGALDLLITVDTMVAHLGGALGVPVWTLLHAEPDWRWRRGRADSAWYPTMRLFRQPAPGDWASVVSTVADELGRIRQNRR